MTGTWINAGAIVAGGLCGAVCGKALTQKHQETLNMVCGVATLFIGLEGAMSKLLSIQNGILTAGHEMFLVLCLVLGGLVGESLQLERGIERFGEWLKRKTGNAKDKRFVEGFLTATLTVCIGAMAVVGAIEDGLTGNWSILGTKAILDFVIVMVMTCTFGKGCVFSAIPVLLFEGTITLLAQILKPLMTDAALINLSMVGSVLIFCVGVNLMWGKKVRVANLLPALIFAAGAAFLPF